MAPNFFTKLVKVASPTSRERRPSESSSPRTSEVVPRRSRSSSKSQAKATSPTTPTQTNTLNSKDTQVSTYITINKAPSRTSIESAGSSSTQPNVTVIPPSPLVHAGEFIENDDDFNQFNEKHSITAVSTLDLTTPTNSEPPSMPTPTPTPTSASASTPTSTPTPTPTLPPVSPPQNLSNGKANPAMASSVSLAANTLQVRKKSSAQSIRSVKKVPSELNLNVNTNAAPTSADTGSDSITKTIIVDSPPDIKSTLPAVVPTPERPHGGSTLNLTAQRQNTDTASINSKSSRPWHRSNSRKPTGLASAIAASGLAMANPTLSPTHIAQISPPSIISPQQSISSATSKKSAGSPPYMSISPAQSSTSQKTRRSVELSPKMLKPKKSINGMSMKSAKSSRQRKSSVSVNSDNGSEYYAAGGDEVRPEYYSGLEGSSDEGSGSDLDSDLELGDDDIPVTGFAVASNKRNADFHELFPTVPEGDYLIEGGWFILRVHVLILIFLFFD